MTNNRLKEKARRHLPRSLSTLWRLRPIYLVLGLQFLLMVSFTPVSPVLLALFFLITLGVGAFFVRPDNQAPKTNQKPPASPQAEQSIQMILDAIPEPTIVLDRSGLVRFINEPAQTTFDRLNKGETFLLKFRDPDIKQALEHVQRRGHSMSVAYCERVPTERHYLINFSPIADHEQKTPSSWVERVLPDLIFVLLLEQTERFRLQELRSDFIANVSHELRTPLASLIGFIETLLGPARDDAENRQRFLGLMLDQSQRMSRLVDDLLSLNQIEMRAHLPPSDEVDLRLVVHHVVDVLTPMAMACGVRLEIDDTEQRFIVKGDRDELIQLLQNLIENACKYGSDGKRVRVGLDEVIRPDDVIGKGASVYRVQVQDFGKGIAAEHLPRLTERFYRVDQEESKRKRGTGLGLAVAKHILMRHMSELKISSIEKKGALFEFFMPPYEGG